MGYEYDASHNLLVVTDWAGKRTEYSYYDAGELKKATLPNSTWTEYGYDGAGRLTEVANRRNAAGVVQEIATFGYTLDAVGNRTTMTDSARPATSYEYDVLDRLKKTTWPDTSVNNYTYDSAGNRLTRKVGAATTSYTYDGTGWMTTAGGVAYGYDANGNQTSRGSDGYSYDHEDRLVGATIAGATTTHKYNGDGLRASSTKGAATTGYVWDVAAGQAPVLLSDGANTYLWGAGLIHAASATGARQYHHPDALGSTRALTDANGATITTRGYDSFGALRYQTGTATSVFQYAGEQLDAGTGLYYLRARYYDPNTGRMVSRDPFPGFASGPQTQNPYAYAVNNPVRYTDLSGLVSIPGICGCGSGGYTWTGASSGATSKHGPAAGYRGWGVCGPAPPTPLGPAAPCPPQRPRALRDLLETRSGASPRRRRLFCIAAGRRLLASAGAAGGRAVGRRLLRSRWRIAPSPRLLSSPGRPGPPQASVRSPGSRRRRAPARGSHREGRRGT